MSFDGEMTNNCFYGASEPIISRNGVVCEPLFTGDDVTDKDSFRLSSASQLIGAGVQAQEDMGDYDFYGNELTDGTHNIGCYEGEGVDDGQFITRDSSAFSSIMSIIGRLYGLYILLMFLF